MTTWWSEERINATVKQDYIEKELGSKRHVAKLNGVLSFGDGLTDDTYLDWILERSSRIFLTLNQIGVPEKIFEFIDKSFTDDDLPLSQDNLWDLNLFGCKSETLDKKFHREQFNFLVQELERGGHVDYGSWDVVPIDPVNTSIRRPSVGGNHNSSDKVHIKRKLYTRTKIASPSEKGLDEVPFLMNLKALTNIQHAHLVSIWGSYSQEDDHYVILQPPVETSLKVFLNEPPKAFKSLEKSERRDIFLTWTHCLTSAVAYLHSHDLLHQSIRPSTIFVDHKFAVVLNDYSALKNLEIEDTNSPYSNELYEYSAPENWFRKPCLHETEPLKVYLPGGGRTARRIPKPAPPNFKQTLPLPSSPNPEPRKRADSKSASSGSSTNTRPRNAIITTLTPNQGESPIASSASHQKRGFPADVFSLTAVLITLLSQVLQHSPKSFASHRSRLNRQAGRGTAPPDSSFHKNLSQVEKWIDMLVKEAGQREKKDMKFWGAIVEITKLCKQGIKKDPRERLDVKELEQKLAGWVHWGLERRRRCSCTIEEDKNARTNDFINNGHGQEPTSQYRIPKLQGSKYHVNGRKHREDLQSEHSGPSSAAGSVDIERGSTQPPSIQFSNFNFPRKPSTSPSISASVEVQQPYSRDFSIDGDKKSMHWGLDDLAEIHHQTTRPDSIASGEQSTIWGLNDISDEEDDRMTNTPSISKPSAKRNYGGASALSPSVANGSVGSSRYGDEDYDSESEYSTDTEIQRVDWPLPLGTLTLS
ncbi:hypothetical protein ACLMJK_007518 [Lecanora helva]